MYTSVLDTAIERKLMKPYGLKLIRQYFLFVLLLPECSTCGLHCFDFHFKNKASTVVGDNQKQRPLQKFVCLDHIFPLKPKESNSFFPL